MEYVYGALLLHKLGKPVDADSLKKVVTAAGATADDSKIKTLVASLKDVDIDKELESASLVSAAAAPAASDGGASGGDAGKVEEKEKPKEKKEEAAEGLSALFG